jgi:hypothetical protein
MELVTDLTVRSREDAIEKLRWYGLRWKIETFHKILKSGCKAEEAKLRAAERIVNLLAILCLLSWRIFWMTMLNRTQNPRPDLCDEQDCVAQECGRQSLQLCSPAMEAAEHLPGKSGTGTEQ